MEQSRSLTFREEMTGFLAQTNGADEQRKHNETVCRCVLVITITDLDAFLADATVNAVVEGSVRCPHLGGDCVIEKRTFNLLVSVIPNRPSIKDMRYRLFLHDPSGRKLTLLGVKYVDRHGILRLWRDTTTLWTRIFDGHLSEEAERHGIQPIARGVLRITVVQFVRQVLSFRSNGPTRLSRVMAVMAFMRTFVSRLWEVYGPMQGKGSR